MQPVRAVPRWPNGTGGVLTCVEDAIRAATRGGVNQLRDGEGQPLGSGRSRETHVTYFLGTTMIISISREAE